MVYRFINVYVIRNYRFTNNLSKVSYMAELLGRDWLEYKDRMNKLIKRTYDIGWGCTDSVYNAIDPCFDDDDDDDDDDE